MTLFLVLQILGGRYSIKEYVAINSELPHKFDESPCNFLTVVGMFCLSKSLTLNGIEKPENLLLYVQATRTENKNSDESNKTGKQATEEEERVMTSLC